MLGRVSEKASRERQLLRLAVLSRAGVFPLLTTYHSLLFLREIRSHGPSRTAAQWVPSLPWGHWAVSPVWNALSIPLPSLVLPSAFEASSSFPYGEVGAGIRNLRALRIWGILEAGGESELLPGPVSPSSLSAVWGE